MGKMGAIEKMNVQQGRYCSDIIKMMIGKTVKQYRESAKLSIIELADQCKCARATIKNIESGRYAPGYNLLYKIATAVGTSARCLIPE